MKKVKKMRGLKIKGYLRQYSLMIILLIALPVIEIVVFVCELIYFFEGGKDYAKKNEQKRFYNC